MSNPAVVEIDDYWEWDALARTNEWTDGLPVAPPTEERVTAVIDYLQMAPDKNLGLVLPLNGKATVEQVAIQSVMAGCLPEHVPTVIAALDALVDNRFNLEGVQGTTNPCAPLTIACGPQVERLNFNVGDGVFGGGARANAAIGRAIRLILWNLGGGKPGRTDRSPLGQPAKYAFCVGENSAESPWSSLSEDFGFNAAQDSVIVFACQSPYPVVLIGSAERMLAIIADSLPCTALNAFHAAGQVLIVFSLRPAQVLADAGYSREDVRRWIFENARFNLGNLRQRGLIVESTDPVCNYWGDKSLEAQRPNLDELPDDTWLPLVQSESDLHLLVTGGRGQWFGGFCPGWGNYGGSAVARSVAMPSK